MRFLWVILLGLLLFLQYKLWWGQGGVRQVQKLQNNVAHQLAINSLWHQKNNKLVKKLDDLKHHRESLEEYARQHMGMISEGEVFYRLVD